MWYRYLDVQHDIIKHKIEIIISYYLLPNYVGSTHTRISYYTNKYIICHYNYVIVYNLVHTSIAKF